MNLGRIRMGHNLHQTEAVADIDKRDAAVIAVGLHPAIEADLLADVRGRKITATRAFYHGSETSGFRGGGAYLSPLPHAKR